MDRRTEHVPTGSLDLYFREIAGSEPLDLREEAELARRWREEGDQRALDVLVRANLRFVVAVARRYRDRGLPMEDLVNEGNLGLLRAARRFDGRRGVRFISYAVWWIRQSILRALESSAPPLLPRAAPGSGPGARGGAGGRSPRPRAHLVSLDQPLADRPGSRLSDLLADERVPAPDRGLELRTRRDSVDARLAALPEREEKVLRLYFGLGGEGPCGLAEIAREIGVSRERVRQIKARALSRLRAVPPALG